MEQIPPTRLPGDSTPKWRGATESHRLRRRRLDDHLACVTMGRRRDPSVPDNTAILRKASSIGAAGERAGRVAFAAQAASQRQDARRHRAIMDACIRSTPSAARVARSATWDSRCPTGTGTAPVRSAVRAADHGLSVNIHLFDALDRCWEILGDA